MTKNRRTRRREAGFTFIETLIAAALLLIVAIGILPLFTRAILNNASGADSTTVSNHAASGEETGLNFNLGDPALTIASGSTSLVTRDFWTGGSGTVGDTNEGWTTTPTGAGRGLITWRRTTQIRQFKVFDLATPLDGNAQPSDVDLKEIQVVLEPVFGLTGATPTVGQNVLHTGRGITVLTLKSQ